VAGGACRVACGGADRSRNRPDERTGRRLLNDPFRLRLLWISTISRSYHEHDWLSGYLFYGACGGGRERTQRRRGSRGSSGDLVSPLLLLAWALRPVIFAVLGRFWLS